MLKWVQVVNAKVKSKIWKSRALNKKDEQKDSRESETDASFGDDKPPPVPPRRSKSGKRSSARGQLGNSWPYDAQRNWSEQLENNEDGPNQCVGQLQTEWGSPQFTRFSNPEGETKVQNDFRNDLDLNQSSPVNVNANNNRRTKPCLKNSKSSSSLISDRERVLDNYNFHRRFSVKDGVPNRSEFNPGIPASNSDHKYILTHNAPPDLRRSPNSWPRLQMTEADDDGLTEAYDHVDSFYASKNDKSVARSKSLNDTVSREQNQLKGFRPHSFNGLRDRNLTTEPETVNSAVPGRMDTPVIKPTRFERKNYKDLDSGIEISRGNSLPCDTELRALLGGIPDVETDSVAILPSPRVSPDIFHDIPGLAVTSDSEDNSGDSITSGALLHLQKGQQFLAVPRKLHRGRRRHLSASASCSEESDNEPSPPISRRGRRSAIVDTKNVGDVSPTNLSPDGSPATSCDEGETRRNGRVRRHRSSLEAGTYNHPGDFLASDHHRKLLKRNTIAEFSLNRGPMQGNSNEDSKKGRQSSFSLLKLMRSRSKEAIAKLEDVLANMKPSEFKDNHLLAYKNLHWSELIASSDKHNEKTSEQLQLSEVERKRREAVWELFQSECVFLVNHLMVLKHCFMEPLKKCQVEGHLMYAEPEDLFGNLDELCYVSYTFCKDFIATLVKAMSSTEFGSTTVLLKAFDRFSSHSKDGDVYHTYCLNYTNALTYLERLRRNDDFNEFEKACCQDPRCQRLKLTDLLVAPLQHCTKLPLLLSNIRKYTEVEDEVQKLTESIARVEMSLQKMEDKMKWAKNYERVQEIARQLSWPPVTDLDPRVFIPEYLKSTLLKQPCDRLLAACADRQLLHEGQLTLIESTKMIDMYLFLFDDILLLTRMKKSAKKKQQNSGGDSKTPLQGDKCLYTVYKQPISLDRICLHDVPPTETAANGIKSAFVLVQISRYQQIIGVFTLQCSNDATKLKWLDKVREAKDGLDSVVSRRRTSDPEHQTKR